MSTPIRLQSSDGVIFEVEPKVAKVSSTIKKMLDLGDKLGSDEAVPLSTVNAKILRKFIIYAEHHKNDPVTTDEDDKNKELRTDDISDFDKDFLNVDRATLMDLILAANYLEAKGLLDAACKTVANMIKGKTPDEIRQTFDIVNDFTAAEEKAMREENNMLLEVLGRK